MATITDESRTVTSDSERVVVKRAAGGTVLPSPRKNKVHAEKTSKRDRGDVTDRKTGPILRNGKYKTLGQESSATSPSKKKKIRVQWRDKEKLEEVFLIESYKLYNSEMYNMQQPTCSCNIF